MAVGRRPPAAGFRWLRNRYRATADATPACEAGAPLASVTATTAVASSLRQPSTASYSQHIQPELGIRYT
jgi:hypothetical protein